MFHHLLPSPWRAEIIPTPQTRPAQSGLRLTKSKSTTTSPTYIPWAQLLQRVFKIDIETCQHCGGKVKVRAIINSARVIEKILSHLERLGQIDRSETSYETFTAYRRGPPSLLI